MTMVFQELRFYLTRTLSSADKEELRQVIKENGGVVSTVPIDAIQIVACETLDARHPEWISTDFIKDSVACESLQNLSEYSGTIYTMDKKDCTIRQRGRMKYTVEDDARMLHFAKMRGWSSMQSMAESAWRQAESDRVTLHSAQSMHEHFRKQLQRKTLIEQRSIMAKAAAVARKRILEQETTVEKQEEEATEEGQSHRGFCNGATLESTTLTQNSRQSSSSNGHRPKAAASETFLVEDSEEKGPKRGDRRKLSRKPTSSLRISQRLKRSKERESSGTSLSPIAAISNTSTPHTIPVAQATPEREDQSADRKSQKRTPNSETIEDQCPSKKQQKRKVIASGIAVNQEISPSCQALEDSCVESSTSEKNGVFFRSVWTQLTRDHTKRRILQRFFESPSTHAPEVQRNTVGLAVTHENDVVISTAAEDNSGRSTDSEQAKAMEHATDEDTDRLVYQLQFDTHQNVPTIVHAMYYCSGDVDKAKAFLKGAAPSDMWSPEDDLLLVDLVAKAQITRLAVDAAKTRGDFASMRVSRDTNAIWKRIQFLR